MTENAVLAEIRMQEEMLSELEKKIYELIIERWPTSAIEIAEYLGEDLSSRESKKNSSTKYTYYLQKLIDKKLLLSKRSGNSLIVWPVLVEKYRVIHNILTGK